MILVSDIEKWYGAISSFHTSVNPCTVSVEEYLLRSHSEGQVFAGFLPVSLGYNFEMLFICCGSFLVLLSPSLVFLKTQLTALWDLFDAAKDDVMPVKL